MIKVGRLQRRNLVSVVNMDHLITRISYMQVKIRFLTVYTCFIDVYVSVFILLVAWLF